jgi:hypothetical protein
MSAPTANGAARRGVIGAVTTPLKYLVLALLVVELLLGGLASGFEAQRTLLVWAIICYLAAFTLIVVGLAILRPEALSGTRPWQPNLAQKFALDLIMSLEGAMENLSPRAKTEAWATVADVITSDKEVNREYLVFCEIVAKHLRKQNEVRDRLREPPSP